MHESGIVAPRPHRPREGPAPQRTIGSMPTDDFRTAAEHGLMAGAPPFPEERRVTLANWQDPPFNRWASSTSAT
jgi:hypothetical protein